MMRIKIVEIDGYEFDIDEVEQIVVINKHGATFEFSLAAMESIELQKEA